MITITIELPDDIATRLASHAAQLKTSVTELAEAFVVRGIEDEEAHTWDPSLTPEDIAAIEAGLADVKAGRVVPHEVVVEDVRQLLARS
jgi:predicted transcriptional regulator